MKIIYFLMVILLSTTVIAQIDSNVLRFIQQEEEKSTNEMKKYMDERLEVQQTDVQKQIDANLNVFRQDLSHTLNNTVIKLAIVWFIGTLLSLLCYRLIFLQLKRKFIRKGLREEFT